jgi:hypothetical protein
MEQITPFSLWRAFKSWVNTQQGGFTPPQSIFMEMANTASLQLWKKWTAQAEKSQEIKDNLLPFLVSKNIITTQSNSFYATFVPPQNYGRFATAKILLTKDNTTVPDIEIDKGKCCKGNKQNIKFVPESDKQDTAEDYYNNTREAAIEMIDNQKWSAMLEHLTKFPTFEKPKITQIDSKFKVAPREVSVVVLNYYTEPIDAVFGYTPVAGNVQTGSGGAIAFNPNTSVNFQWSKQVKPDLLEELKLVYIGYTRDGLFAQIANAQKTNAAP